MSGSNTAVTVRVICDVRTFEGDDLLKILRAEGDNFGDHIVAVTLPALGFEGKAKAGGTHVHEHEPEDRPCKAIGQSERLWRDDGEDEF